MTKIIECTFRNNLNKERQKKIITANINTVYESV